MNPEDEARLRHKSNATLRIYQSLDGDEINETAIAESADVDVLNFYHIRNYTIPGLIKRINKAKLNRQFNRQKLSDETGIDVRVIKFIEQDLRKQKLDDLMPQINHLQDLVRQHCASFKKWCNPHTAEKHFKSDKYNRYFYHTVISYEQEGRRKKRKEWQVKKEITNEIVEIFFRQIKYCLWIGIEHCNSLAQSDYFLTKPFERIKQFENLFKKMHSIAYDTLKPETVEKLTVVIRCLLANHVAIVDTVIEDTPSCPRRNIISVLIDNDKRDKTQDVDLLRKCLVGVNVEQFHKEVLPTCISEI